MGFAFHFQFQTQARRSETGWCVIWWDAACTTSSHSTGTAAGVCSGSECFAARPSGGQVFSLSPADSIPWWWGFVESAGQIAIFFIATWWEAPYSHPQESFCSPVDAVSAFHHETCWCLHFDFRCSEKLLGVWFASHSQTSEEDVCVMPAPGLRSMYPTHGSVTRGAGESSSALCCDCLDHAGPLYCCDTPRRKYWVLLFTCGVVHAVHLELVDALSTYDTVLAFRRLVARRGLPKVIYSDNAKGFVAAPDKILGQFGPLTPEWRFIAPNSPWWGGWWERLVRSVKSALRKTVGGNCLARAELETTLHEIEACINSRPLTFVSDDPDQEKPLTPSHFLLGHDSHYLSERSEPAPIETADDARRRFDLRQSVVDKFWVVWSSEYLRNLPPWRGVSQGHTLREGSVVLVEADHRPRLQWPLGIITQVFPGKDGLIRTVEVKTSSGKLERSVQRVHDLEIMNNGFSDTLTTCASAVNRSDNVSSDTAEMTENRVEIEPEREVYRTRFGRVVKPVVRFDI